MSPGLMSLLEIWSVGIIGVFWIIAWKNPPK